MPPTAISTPPRAVWIDGDGAYYYQLWIGDDSYTSEDGATWNPSQPPDLAAVRFFGGPLGAVATYRLRLAAALGVRGAKRQITTAAGGSIHASTLYDVLQGRTTPSLDLAESIGLAAGVPLWELLAPADVVAREKRRRAKTA